MTSRLVCMAIVLALNLDRLVAGQEATSSFQAFVNDQAVWLRSDDRAPSSVDEWERRRKLLRENLAAAWAAFPEVDCPLAARKLAEIQRDGYRVEKILLQTRPDVWMTANAYVPDKPGKLPAILHVHGHSKGAKQDPVVQSRCIGCAKLGFFVLCVDAFGAGERGVGTSLGEYHGELTAATLFPVGLPLSGLQVYENKRAVDYLMERPEVDPQRTGITGSSGGGNQSMYAGAYDERLRCAVPVCSVGNYQAYLGAACCMCEVVPGALRFTEEGDVLGLAAHRGLMIINATRDARQFSVAESQKSFTRAEQIAALYPRVATRRTVIEAGHDYNQPMREAMYGWMTLHLKHEGDGSPIPEPPHQTEDPELLRCFPGDSRPADYVTIPQFAKLRALELADKRPVPDTRSDWEKARTEKIKRLIESLGGLPKPTANRFMVEDAPDGNSQVVTFESEPGITLTAHRDLPERPGRVAVVIDLDRGADEAWSHESTRQLRDAGWSIVVPELRATGRYSVPHDSIGNAIDHNSAEWSLWIGRPLIGQWVHDIRRMLDAIAERDGSLPHDMMVTGENSSAVVALFAAALDERFTRVKIVNPLVSYATDKPYRGWRLGLMVPGILRDVGDIADMASLVAPRAITIQGGKAGDGSKQERHQVAEQFSRTKRIFELLDVPNVMVIEK